MWPTSWSLKPRRVDTPRWIVLDVESSGLDPSRDRLLAVAAVAVRVDGGRAGIDLADSFETVLQQPSDARPPDKPNILVHGIGVAAQAAGRDPVAALTAFEAYAGASPLLGYHAAFDRRLIERAMQAKLGRRLPNRWLDIADVASVLHPGVEARALDDWLGRFGIECIQRHQAAADTLATAELLLRLWPAARAEGAKDFASLARLASRRRWLA